jgi:hypothetical protein
MKKKETIEEAAKDYIENTMKFSFDSLETKTQANRMLKCVEFGAKWQQEQDRINRGLLEIELEHTKRLLESCEKALEDRDKQIKSKHSEEEVEIIISKLMNEVHCGDICYGENIIDFKVSPRQWFEQYKKK